LTIFAGKKVTLQLSKPPCMDCCIAHAQCWFAGKWGNGSPGMETLNGTV